MSILALMKCKTPTPGSLLELLPSIALSSAQAIVYNKKKSIIKTTIEKIGKFNSMHVVTWYKLYQGIFAPTKAVHFTLIDVVFL